MSNNITQYSTHVRLEQDGDELYYIAEHPEIEGCFSDGETVAEALNNLEEVTTIILDHLREHNLPIPEPRSIITPKRIKITSRFFRDVLDDVQPHLEITPLVPA